jgi:TcpE family
MELPTYTNIWKIEKRLYKLYDFRLPMPLPVGQVAAFLAIAIPYMLILTMAGMPFSHTWVWLYVLPPGVLAWLVTRPVLEGKRLPELVLSQLRYLSEPRTWCRMAALAEKDQMFVTARVWRRPAAVPFSTTADAAASHSAATAPATTAIGPTAMGPAAMGPTAPAMVVTAFDGGDAEARGVFTADAETADDSSASVSPARPVWPTRPAIVRRQPAQASPAQASPAQASSAQSLPAQSLPAQSLPAQARSTQSSPARARPAQSQPQQSQPQSQQPHQPTPERARANGGPPLTVRSDSGAARPLHVVERALRSSPGGGTDGWHDRVVVVPGGHRPGKPDQVQRDLARVRMPLAGLARIVVLGCTAGAGQTTTTLLTGHLLANLRGEAVAVLDIGAGQGSLTEQARQIPRLLPGRPGEIGPAADTSRSGEARGLQVVTADDSAEDLEAGTLIDTVAARFPITLADPAAAHVPRALHAADQLVLVAPANADAAGSLAMTMEWLEAHGHAHLARTSVTVLNGVSAQTAGHVDRAAAVAAGRCRAILRVPWDDGLANSGALGMTSVRAYTALAGVLVAGLAESAVVPVNAAESGRR